MCPIRTALQHPKCCVLTWLHHTLVFTNCIITRNLVFKSFPSTIIKRDKIGIGGCPLTDITYIYLVLKQITTRIPPVCLLKLFSKTIRIFEVIYTRLMGLIYGFHVAKDNPNLLIHSNITCLSLVRYL